MGEIRTLQNSLGIADGPLLGIAREIAADGKLLSVEHLTRAERGLLFAWMLDYQRMEMELAEIAMVSA